MQRVADSGIAGNQRAEGLKQDGVEIGAGRKSTLADVGTLWVPCPRFVGMDVGRVFAMHAHEAWAWHPAVAPNIKPHQHESTPGGLSKFAVAAVAGFADLGKRALGLVLVVALHGFGEHQALLL